MTIRNLKAKEFFEFLLKNGFDRPEEYINRYENKEVFVKDREVYVVPIKRLYFPRTICQICNQANIEPPEGFQKVYDQILAINDRTENGED